MPKIHATEKANQKYKGEMVDPARLEPHLDSTLNYF